MKHMFLKVQLALFAIVLLVGCGTDKDYLSALPGNSVLVVKVHVGNLLNESEVLEDHQISGFMKNSINEMSGESRALMREILEDSSTSGVDMKQPVYFVLESLEQVRGLMIVPIADEAKVKKTLQTLLAEGSLSKNTLLAVQNGINTLQNQNGNAIAAFDDEKLVFAFSSGSTDALEYMNLSDKAQERPKALENFIDENVDMAMYLDYGKLMPLVAAFSRDLNGLDLSLFEQMKITASLNFEKGKASITYKVDGCQEMEKCYKEIYCKPDNDLVYLLPSDTWAVAQFGIKNLASIKNLFGKDQALKMDKMFEELNTLLLEKGIQTKVDYDLLNSIQGDVILGATPFVQQGNNKLPQAIFVAECADKKLFDFATALITQANSNAEKIDNNLYRLDLDTKVDSCKGYDYFFGFADGKLFVMPENLYEQCTSDKNLKGFASDLSDNKVMYSVIKNNNAGVLDFTVFTKELEKEGKISFIKNADILRMFELVCVKMEGTTQTEFIVTTTDAETEVLKQIKDICVKLAITEAVK